jgi:hypothetical protein
MTDHIVDQVKKLLLKGGRYDRVTLITVNESTVVLTISKFDGKIEEPPTLINGDDMIYELKYKQAYSTREIDGEKLDFVSNYDVQYKYDTHEKAQKNAEKVLENTRWSTGPDHLVGKEVIVVKKPTQWPTITLKRLIIAFIVLIPVCIVIMFNKWTLEDIYTIFFKSADPMNQEHRFNQ